MDKMSMSFAEGNGCIEHNARRLKGKGIRQNGIKERRKWNHCFKDIDPVEAIKEKIKPLLDEYNNKQIKAGRLSRVMTADKWIETKCYSRNGKPKNLYSEILVQIGDKFTGCNYEIERDADGNMLDTNGKPIKYWYKDNGKGEKIRVYNTKKEAMPKGGIYTPSKISNKLIKVYGKVIEEFEKKHPNMVITTAYVHRDEKGGCHLHVNYIPLSKTKNGIGIGISKRGAVSDYLDSIGVKYDNDKRKDCAVKKFTELWRNDYLPAICKEYGIEREFRGEDGRPQYDIETYGKFNDERIDILEEKDKLADDKEIYDQAVEDTRQLFKEKNEEIEELKDTLKAELGSAKEKKHNAECMLKKAVAMMSEAEALKRVADRTLAVAEDTLKRANVAMDKVTKATEELKVQQDKVEARWKVAEDIVEASKDGIKKYIVNHFNMLKEMPELFDIVHKKVIEKYGNDNTKKDIDRYNGKEL